MDPKQIEILIAVVAALGFGGLIGLERQIHSKPAGMRTHMLVAGAAALLVSLDRMLTARFAAEFGNSGVFRSDPIGVMQAVITAVAFLGAGTIIRQQTGEHVEGLTTAASLGFTAAIGIAAGLNLWLLAAGCTILVLATLRIGYWVDEWVDRITGQPSEEEKEAGKS
ncbi:MAG TPA: MgtC/SapB family protein [Anaerolineae bacterium]